MRVDYVTVTVLMFVSLCSAAWQPTENPLNTPWTEDVNPKNAWPEYPRPQMMRREWLNLNGLWDYALEPVDFTPVQGLIKAKSKTTGKVPTDWQGQILVPFAIDSALSGVKHILRPTERLWYRRSFQIPSTWEGQRILLHFQASDWETSVYLNGHRIGQHRGGYDPFSFDVTSWLRAGNNELTVCVWDGTEQQCQAIGKQIMPENRKGFRYQPTGGVWQTVWLEPVAPTHLQRLKLTPDVPGGRLRIDVTGPRLRGCRLQARVTHAGKEISSAIGQPGGGKPFYVSVPDAQLWSPDSPTLYDLEVSVLNKQGKVVDTVQSYFGMRQIEMKKADDGFNRIFLNGEPIYQFGPLDQGYWPDGILTPPTDEAARFDLQYLKDIGCNMIRVHIKTHPDRWYYWADKLGLLVWQDMICMPKYGQTVDEAAAGQWQKEFSAMLDWLHSHPSIVHWIVFNEGWSQHDTERYIQWVEQRDPSRIVTDASGWTFTYNGDVYDLHDYSFYPGIELADTAERWAILLGEAGGHNLTTPGHTWYQRKAQEKVNYIREQGRMTFSTPEQLDRGYAVWIEGLRALRDQAGCNAVVYTQITDVEHELNGWLTYDRKVSKLLVGRWRALHERLYQPIDLQAVVPSKQSWRYTTSAPVKPKRQGKKGPVDYSGAWTAADFDDSQWLSASAPFGHGTRPHDGAQTQISGNTLFLRQTFDLETLLLKPMLAVVARKNIQVFLNGTLLRSVQLGARQQEKAKINYLPLFPEDLSKFRVGKNVLAVAVPDAAQEGRVDVSLWEDIERCVSAPLFKDPHYHGSCDPEIVWNSHEQAWWIFYTARRATREQGTYVGTPLGVASSKDGTDWTFRGYCSFDGMPGQPDMPVTYWAPGILKDGDTYHMYVTYKDNATPPWGGKGQIVHYTAPADNLLNGWTKADVPAFGQPDPIDATLIKIDDEYRAYYRVAQGGVQWSTSKDLKTWENKGKCPGDINDPKKRSFGYQEAPYIFQWQGAYWLLTDPHKGLAVYRSEDAVTWTLQGRILEEPGTRAYDNTRARHPSVAVIGDRAFLFYHVEPWRPYPTPPAEKRTVEQKRSLLQMAELSYEGGRLTCDRNRQMIFPQR